jgi:hypothetical protein
VSDGVGGAVMKPNYATDTPGGIKNATGYAIAEKFLRDQDLQKSASEINMPLAPRGGISYKDQ